MATRSSSAATPSTGTAGTALEALTRLATALDALGPGDEARIELRSLEHLLESRPTS